MIKFWRTLKTACHALGRNIMRSTLTTLGIIIGIGAVIAMMEIGNGASTSLQRTIASMGANVLIIMPGAQSSGGVNWGGGSTFTLTPSDCEAINRECSSGAAAAPVVQTSAQLVYADKNWSPQNLTGTTPDWLKVRAWTNFTMGECFTDADVQNAAQRCVIGQRIVTELFGDQNPLGKEIRIRNVSFKIVGVLSRKGGNMFGQDQDDIVVAPWTAIKYRVSNQGSSKSSGSTGGSSSSDSVNSLSAIYPSQGSNSALYPALNATQQADTPMPVRFTNVNQILCSAVSPAQIQTAIGQISEVLRERHKLREGELNDFQVRDMTEFTDMFKSTTTLMTMLLLVVAGISLVVGGVGIMNIMLVSVTERTKEIGLRMAVGARSMDILWQFLIEAIILCLAGGALGIALGRGTSLMVRFIMNWPTAISIPAIVAAVLVSAIVGIAFGFYPAWKASRLDPIEALRYE